jgi:hypothetical protein
VPPLPSVSGVIRVAVTGIYGSSNTVVSRFFVHYSGTAPTNAQLNTFCAAVRATHVTNVKPLSGGQWELTEVVAEDLSSATGAVGLWAGADGGSRAGSPLAASTAMVIAYQIARRYRGGHPRGYWPLGVSGDLTGAQEWSSTFQTAVNTGMAAFFAGVLAAGWTGAGTLTHVNVSYFSGFTVVTSPTTGRARNVPTLRGSAIVDTVLGYSARHVPGSQRRRN